MVSIIVAVAQNGVIGKDNELIWRLSDDLKLFKTQTVGNTVIMGRKTYDSIGKPLPNRTNIVISRSKIKIEGTSVVNSLKEAVDEAGKLNPGKEIFIIGGEQIYKLATPLVNKLYLTQVKAEVEGDVFFDLNPFKAWQKVSEIEFEKSDKNQYDFSVSEWIKGN
jgi:dihydrofolate reductase